MANIITHRKSSTASAVPSGGSLALGELAINTADGRLFLKKGDGTVVDVGNSALTSLNFQMNGGGVALTTGIKGFIEVPYACDIVYWTVLLASGAGATAAETVAIDILRSTYSGFATIPSIVGAGTKPGTSSATKNQGAPASWTSVAISAGDILGFQVTTAPATAQMCTLSLRVQRK